MKTCILFIFILLGTACFAAPLNKVVTNGNWSAAVNWSLGRLPQVGDTILIPAGKTITVSDDQTINGFAYLKIYGRLLFQNNNSTLKLGSTAAVLVYATGQIAGGGSPSQKLKIGNNTVFDGNDAPVIGPMMATVSNGFQAFVAAALPVKFIGFTLTRKGADDVLVQWSTSEEINADRYELERSYDGANWQPVTTVTAHSNTNSVNNYSYVDKKILRTAYYRVKEIDMDGQAAYTAIISIKHGETKAADINITAVGHKLLLQFPQQVNGNISIRFISVNGQLIEEQTISNPIGQVILNAKASGNCIIAISNAQGLKLAKQVNL